jgi:hypothetical protein
MIARARVGSQYPAGPAKRKRSASADPLDTASGCSRMSDLNAVAEHERRPALCFDPRKDGC